MIPSKPPTKISSHDSAAESASIGIEVRGLRRIFQPGNVVAIDSLDLPISAGQFLAILGPSGCGKSTLLRLIAHLDRADAGEIIFKTSDGLPPRVAYVFQDAHLLPWRNVLRNVSLPLELKGVAKSEQRDRAQAALSQVGLADVIKRYPAQLSGGMRMRVSLARALVTEPNLLLLDEPFAALDEITRQQLDDDLRSLWLAKKMTVIFVTHSIVEATFLADRALVFSKRPARIVGDHNLAAIFPRERDGSLRGDASFAAATRAMFESLLLGSRE